MPPSRRAQLIAERFAEYAAQREPTSPERKRKREDAAPKSATREAVAALAASPAPPEPSVDEGHCTICHGSRSELECELLDHSCGTCAPGAWAICDECEENFISKTCPVCRSAYCARLYYKFPLVDHPATHGFLMCALFMSQVVVVDPAASTVSVMLRAKLPTPSGGDEEDEDDERAGGGKECWLAVEGARLPDGAFCARENVLSWTQALWDSFGETDDDVTSIIEDVGDAYDKLFEWQRGDDESEDSAWSESSGRLIMTVKTTEHTLEHMRVFDSDFLRSAEDSSTASEDGAGAGSTASEGGTAPRTRSRAVS